jgi:hypothetical protein
MKASRLNRQGNSRYRSAGWQCVPGIFCYNNQPLWLGWQSSSVYKWPKIISKAGDNMTDFNDLIYNILFKYHIENLGGNKKLIKCIEESKDAVEFKEKYSEWFFLNLDLFCKSIERSDELRGIPFNLYYDLYNSIVTEVFNNLDFDTIFTKLYDNLKIELEKIEA